MSYCNFYNTMLKAYPQDCQVLLQCERYRGIEKCKHFIDTSKKDGWEGLKPLSDEDSPPLGAFPLPPPEAQ